MVVDEAPEAVAEQLVLRAKASHPLQPNEEWLVLRILVRWADVAQAADVAVRLLLLRGLDPGILAHKKVLAIDVPAARDRRAEAIVERGKPWGRERPAASESAAH